MNDHKHGAYIYARTSTKHQKSIREQIEYCTRYCRDHGLAILGLYSDEGVSGTRLSRPDFDRMMLDLQNGGADTIVIYDMSRIIRDRDGWFELRAQMNNIGVCIYSATQEFVGGDLNESGGYLHEYNQADFDQKLVRVIRGRVKNSLRHNAQKGLHTGGKPALGYKAVPAADGHKRLVIDETEAKIVHRIFEEYTGGKSYRQIIEGLNRDGIRTKSGNAWGTNSLHDLLHNPLYTGRVIYGSNVYRADGSRNTHAPEGTDVIERQDDDLRIIPQEIFEAVREKAKQNVHNKPGRPSIARDYPLRGKVFCGECGSTMVVAASKMKGRTYFYYRCANRAKSHSCVAKPIRCENLEKIVLEQIQMLIADSDIDIRERATIFLEDYVKKINERELQHRNNLANEINSINAKISSVNDKIERAIDVLEEGNCVDSLKNRLAVYEKEKNQLLLQLDELKRTVEKTIVPSGQIVISAEQKENMCSDLCSLAKKDAVSVFAVISRVEIYNDYIKIYTELDQEEGEVQ